MKYLYIIEKGKRNFSAYVPDLPGCVAAAKTRVETEKLIKEAIEFHIEGMLIDGEKIPEPTTKGSGFYELKPSVKNPGKRKSARKRKAVA
jgi:predicted RNase H-like HicB family nuclease